MGLNQSQKGNRTFVSIVNGKFAQRVTQETPNSVRRMIEKKDGSKKEVWELIYDNVSGNITSIEVDESGDFGDQLKINMEDIGDKFTVNLNMQSREAKSFLCALKNINLLETITLHPYNFQSKDDGRNVIGMNVYQGGVGKEFKVKPYFSKDTTNGLPQVPENADKDEFKLCMKQQEIYLKKWVKKFIADNFVKEKVNYSAPANKITPNKMAEKASTNVNDSSDLPF